jgi:hypothetical protein
MKGFALLRYALPAPPAAACNCFTSSRSTGSRASASRALARVNCTHRAPKQRRCWRRNGNAGSRRTTGGRAAHLARPQQHGGWYDVLLLSRFLHATRTASRT